MPLSQENIDILVRETNANTKVKGLVWGGYTDEEQWKNIGSVQWDGVSARLGNEVRDLSKPLQANEVAALKQAGLDAVLLASNKAELVGVLPFWAISMLLEFILQIVLRLIFKERNMLPLES